MDLDEDMNTVDYSVVLKLFGSVSLRVWHSHLVTEEDKLTDYAGVVNSA